LERFNVLLIFNLEYLEGFDDKQDPNYTIENNKFIAPRLTGKVYGNKSFITGGNFYPESSLKIRDNLLQ